MTYMSFTVRANENRSIQAALIKTAASSFRCDPQRHGLKLGDSIVMFLRMASCALNPIGQGPKISGRAQGDRRTDFAFQRLGARAPHRVQTEKEECLANPRLCRSLCILASASALLAICFQLLVVSMFIALMAAVASRSLRGALFPACPSPAALATASSH